MRFCCNSLGKSITRTFLAASLASFILAPASSLLAQRLPSTVRPEHYALTLTPDLKAATFTGVESIDVTFAEPTNAIVLNSAEIAFQSVVAHASGKEQTATVSLDKDKEQATFTFPEKLRRKSEAENQLHRHPQQ